MFKKVANASAQPVTIRLVKRENASVGFSDGIKPAGGVDNATELTFELGGYTKDQGLFVIGSTITPNIKDPQNYIDIGEDFTITDEGDVFKLNCNITTNDQDPNYVDRKIGIFYRLKSIDGLYVMASPNPTHYVSHPDGTSTQVDKDYIRNTLGQWFNDDNYYVPIYLGTLKDLYTNWMKSHRVGMPELYSLSAAVLTNDLTIAVDLPLESVTILNEGLLEIGTDVEINHTHQPAIANVTKVTYSVNDTSIAEFVGDTNVLSIKSMGSVDVTVSLTDNLGNTVATTKTFQTTLSQQPLIATYQVNNSLINLELGSMDIPTGFVDWGDGTVESVNGQTIISHQYVGASKVDVKVWSTSELGYLSFQSGDDLLEIKQWGDAAIPRASFIDCEALTSVPDTEPVGFIDANSMFRGCLNFNQSLQNWDVSNVTDFTAMFQNATAFNGQLDAWDTSSGTAFERMFEGCTSFNRNINTWDMSNARDVSRMFAATSMFNQPLNAWTLGYIQNSVDASEMFDGAISFNQPVSNLINSNVIAVSAMFRNAVAFNQDLSGCQFHQGLTSFDSFLEGCTSFNGNVGTLNGAQPVSVASMFKGCSSFNQSLTGIDFSKVTGATEFLSGCSIFNQPLGTLEVGSLVDATSMFEGCSRFTSDLSLWDVSNLRVADRMFYGTSDFDSDLNWWCVANIPTAPADFATDSFLASSNYPTWGTCPVRDVVVTITNQSPFLLQGVNDTLVFETNKPITIETVSWTSSNTDAVVVNEATGEYAVVGLGGTTISVTVNGLYRDSRQYEVIPSTGMGEYVIVGDGELLTIENKANQARSGDVYVDWGTGEIVRVNAGDNASNRYDVGTNTSLRVIAIGSVGADINVKGASLVEVASFGVLNTLIESSGLTTVPASISSDITALKLKSASAFNDPNISSWDVSNLTDMSGMFEGATIFNQPMNTWNVSKVTTMQNMFSSAEAFNQPLGEWDVSKVMNMGGMFRNAAAFDQSLASWCVTNILSEPAEFSLNSPLVNDHKPVWGTCPTSDYTLTIAAFGELMVGRVEAMRYTLTPTVNNPSVKWSVDNEVVATVDADGNLTALAEGTVEVTLVVNNYYRTTRTVTVVPEQTILPPINFTVTL